MSPRSLAKFALLLVMALAGCSSYTSLQISTDEGISYRANGGIFHCHPMNTCEFQFPDWYALDDEVVITEDGYKFAGWRSRDGEMLCPVASLASCIENSPDLWRRYKEGGSVLVLKSSPARGGISTKSPGNSNVTVSTRTRIVFYQVDGENYDELLDLVYSDQNPLFDKIYDDNTVASVDFDTSIEWKVRQSASGQCEVASAEALSTMLVTLPWLGADAGLDQAAQQLWDQFYTDTVAHEATHLDINRESIRLTAASLEIAGNACRSEKDFDEYIDALITSIELWAEECDDRFHQVTDEGMLDTAKFVGSITDVTMGRTSRKNCLTQIRSTLFMP